MKTNGVAIMMIIMLGFAQAYSYSNHESDNVFDKLSCPAQCGIDCVIANLLYPVCYAICVSKCHKKSSNAVNDCLSTCGLTNPINVKSPAARDAAIHQVESCLQKCGEK
ncbi:hypothetical protein Fmac_012128 [Flemingia macrophylla]|uniref:Thionin-like protein n=1 Tax=Flemingia macrophylla TaxID=520843 RepID=A0ABD1MQ97_9FABA